MMAEPFCAPPTLSTACLCEVYSALKAKVIYALDVLKVALQVVSEWDFVIRNPGS